MIHAQDLRILPKIIVVPDEFESLSEAISHANSGDIIYVRNGVYRESVIIDKPVILIGESAEGVVVDGGKSSYTLLVNSSNVILSGFTIVGGGVKGGIAGMGAGLEVHGASNVIITNNRFVNNRMAIYVHSSRDVVIHGNTLHENREGIYLTKSSNVVISNNRIVDNPAFGIHAHASGKNRITRNTIIGSIRGIYLYNNSEKNEVSGNLIRGGDVLVVNSSYNAITGNTIFGRGLLLIFSGKNTVTGNSINGMPLIYLEDADGEVVEAAGQVILINCNNITLRGLKISGIGVGVELWKTNNTKILYSSFSGNEVAVYMYSSHNNEVSRSLITSNNIGLFISSSSNNEVHGNVINSNLYGVILMDSWGNRVENNTISHSLNYGILSINSQVNEVDKNEFFGNFGDIQNINE